MSKNVWQTVHMDYLGPFPDDRYALIMIHEKLRYPVVAFTNSTSIKHLKSIFGMTFSRFGYAEELVSNNVPPLRLEEIKCCL